MWQIKEEIYYLLICQEMYPEEEKVCCKGTRGTEKLLYIDKGEKNEM